MTTRREFGVILLDQAIKQTPKSFLTGKIIVRDPQTLDAQIPDGELTSSHGLAPEFTPLGRLANRLRIHETKADKTGKLGTPEQRARTINLLQEWRDANRPRNKQKENVVIVDRHTLAQSL